MGLRGMVFISVMATQLLFSVESTRSAPRTCVSTLEVLMLKKAGIHLSLESLLRAQGQVATEDLRIGIVVGDDGQAYFFNHIHAPKEKVFDHPAAKKIIDQKLPSVVLAFGGLLIGSVNLVGGRYEIRIKEVMRSMTEKLFLRSPPAPADLMILVRAILTQENITVDATAPVSVLWPDTQSPTGRIVSYSGLDFWGLLPRATP